MQVREDHCGHEASTRRKDTEHLTDKATGGGDVLQDGKGEDGPEMSVSEWQAGTVRPDQSGVASRCLGEPEGMGTKVYPNVHGFAQSSHREFPRPAAQVQQGTLQEGGTDVPRLDGPVQRVRQRRAGQIGVQHLIGGFHAHGAGLP